MDALCMRALAVGGGVLDHRLDWGPPEGFLEEVSYAPSLAGPRGQLIRVESEHAQQPKHGWLEYKV